MAVSHREPERTRAYPLPVTGVGQLLAVAAMWQPDSARRGQPQQGHRDPRKQCVVFAGVHTYGMGAAAAYLVRQWWKPIWWRRRGVAAVIEVEVVDGHAIRSKRIRFRRLG